MLNIMRHLALAAYIALLVFIFFVFWRIGGLLLMLCGLVLYFLGIIIYIVRTD